jgi:hypothetical protein
MADNSEDFPLATGPTIIVSLPANKHKQTQQNTILTNNTTPVTAGLEIAFSFLMALSRIWWQN